MNNKEVYPPSFSKFYDRMMGDFATDIAPQIYDIYCQEPIYNQEKTLLDICCGAGHLACYFLNKGFQIIGIDLSEKMLELAQNKTQNNYQKAEWIKADASNFSLNKKFGIAVSTFDSLNLLPDLDTLEKCFQCVHNHLVNNGIFIFDINTKLGISASNNVYITESDDFTIIAKGYFDAKSDRGFIRFSGFSKLENGLFEKFEHCSSSTVFTINDITNLLISSGFADVKYYIFGKTKMEIIDNPESYLKVAIYAKKAR